MGNIGSGVRWSLCFLVRVREGGATGVGRGIAPDGAVGSGCLDSWEDGEASSVSLFKLPPAYGQVEVGFVCRPICVADVEGCT